MGRNLRTVVQILFLFLLLNGIACHKLSNLFGKKSSTTTNSSTSGANETAGTHEPDGNPHEIVTTSGIHMMVIPAGQFSMGSSDGNPNELPIHKVSIQSFLMDKFPVTYEEFSKLKMLNPSHWQDNAKLPVEQVHWREALRYCNERSRAEGLKPCYNLNATEGICDFNADGYRLPTEAEWEYAARAGSDGPYDFLDRDSLREYAWYGANSGRRTHPVGEKKPNKWGLYDMYGNVSNWCQDMYDASYYTSSPPLDPRGPVTKERDVPRVIRGGNWKASPNMCRATYRQGESSADGDQGFATDYCGFRCVRVASPQELTKLPVFKPKPAQPSE